jgi:hypothetical protein
MSDAIALETGVSVCRSARRRPDFVEAWHLIFLLAREFAAALVCAARSGVSIVINFPSLPNRTGEKGEPHFMFGHVLALEGDNTTFCGSSN